MKYQIWLNIDDFSDHIEIKAYNDIVAIEQFLKKRGIDGFLANRIAAGMITVYLKVFEDGIPCPLQKYTLTCEYPKTY